MGHRLSKIYTRTGDDGKTSLGTGERLDKFDIRIEVHGAIDETNSAIGMLLAEAGADITPEIRQTLLDIQNELFEAGAELSCPGYASLDAAQVEKLETELDALNAELPPLQEFVLPGGNRAAASCHVARTTCRRAERVAWAMAKKFPVNEQLLRYLNRLSDYLFVLARTLARKDGGEEALWRKRLSPGGPES